MNYQNDFDEQAGATGGDAFCVPSAAFLIERLRETISENKEKGSLGIDPGLKLLRSAIRAYIRTHFWVIGGYTSHGKTAFICELISRVRFQHLGVHVLIFSTEMNSDAYILRLIANQTGIPSLTLLQGDHIPEVQSRIDKAFDVLSRKNLVVYDNVYEIEAMASIARNTKEKTGLDLIFIDFLQNLHGKGSIYERMSILGPQIQALAKELDCTIVAASQVSNEAVRDSSDVIGYKGAGEIAAAADLGLWLEREKDGNGSKINSDSLSVIIRKNRHGPTGKAPLKFRDSFTRLEEV